MYAQIYAESLDNRSTGKTMRVWSHVEEVTFGVIEEDQLLVIKATCHDRENSGDRGGDYNPVTRQLLLKLNKEEVEKLVATSLNEKLLKKLNIENIANIDVISHLEIELQNRNDELRMVNEEIDSLRELMGDAASMLQSRLIIV